MDNVQKTVITDYKAPSSEPFRHHQYKTAGKVIVLCIWIFNVSHFQKLKSGSFCIIQTAHTLPSYVQKSVLLRITAFGIHNPLDETVLKEINVYNRCTCIIQNDSFETFVVILAL
jgi:hypothetical protein